MHLEDKCAVDECRHKIRLCFNRHDLTFDDGSRLKIITPVICIECPDHGRVGKSGDFNEFPVVRVKSEKVYILKTGTGMAFEEC